MTLSTDTRLVEALAKTLHDYHVSTMGSIKPRPWNAVGDDRKDRDRAEVRVILDELEKIHPGILPLYPLNGHTAEVGTE